MSIGAGDEGFKKKRILSPWILIIAGSAAVILLGTVLLMLPISSKGKPAPFSDALFTAVSAAKRKIRSKSLKFLNDFA